VSEQNQRHFTAGDGKCIAYYVDDFTDPWTDPPPILLLHSAMGNSQRFHSMVPTLARRHRVVRMDLRGHGGSDTPKPEEPFSLELLVSDAIALLDRLGIGKAHIVGNSAGGYVAQQIAIHHPERTLSLTTYGSTPGLSPAALDWLPQMQKEGYTPFLSRTIHMRFDLKSTDPGLVQWFLKQTAECDPAFVARFITHMASRSWGEELKRVQCPTLVVYPGEETVGGTDGYDPYRRNVKDLRIIGYDHMPHNICDMQPERCAADLLAFLRERFG
jgi:pimeloyl-ACP methyl ester carboxylesterase